MCGAYVVLIVILEKMGGIFRKDGKHIQKKMGSILREDGMIYLFIFLFL